MLKILSHANLTLLAFSGRESFSALYQFDLHVASQSKLSLESLLQNAMAWLVQEGQVSRNFHGIITGVSETGKIFDLFSYKITVQPKIVLLKNTVHNRIYQKMSTTEILDFLCSTIGYANINTQYLQNYGGDNYEMPYNQNSLDFMQQFLAERGIFYFFKHYRDRHELILADDSSAYFKLPADPDKFFQWNEAHQATVPTVTVMDYCFKTANTSLCSEAKNSVKNYPTKKAPHWKVYPAGFSTLNEGENLAKQYLESFQKDSHEIAAFSDSVLLQVGGKFLRDGKEYYITAIDYFATDNKILLKFAAKNVNLSFRPTLNSKHTIGAQLASVANENAETIDTNSYGQVKVVFNWQDNTTPSKWLRCLNWWSGQQYSSQFIPHQNQKVFVQFLHGDPTQPIIVGALYPKPQPTHISGIRTLANSLTFNDESEHAGVYVDAKKNLQINAKNYSSKVNNNVVINASKLLIAAKNNLKITAQKSLTLEVGKSALQLYPDKIIVKSEKIEFKN